MYKKIIQILTLCLPFSGMAQEGFRVSGEIKELKEPAIVYLAIIQNGRYVNVDSATVENGNFLLQGKVSDPQPAILNLQRQATGSAQQSTDQLSLFLENSDIHVLGTDSVKTAVVTGSVSDQQQRELQGKIVPLTKEIIGIQTYFADKPKEELYVDGKPKEEAQRAADRFKHLLEEVKRIYSGFVESHPDSYFALYVYNTNVLTSKFEPQQVEPLFHRFSPELRSSELGKQVWEKIQSAKRMDIGTKATDFTQDDLNGNPFTLSSLRGKYVLVDFWASWCGPCRAENPHLVKAYEALKDKDFEVVGVSLDQNKSAWENAVKTDNLPWIHVSDLKGWKNEVSMLYGINSVPQNFLLNPDGVIIGKNLRGEGLTAKIAELMN